MPIIRNYDAIFLIADRPIQNVIAIARSIRLISGWVNTEQSQCQSVSLCNVNFPIFGNITGCLTHLVLQKARLLDCVAVVSVR